MQSNPNANRSNAIFHQIKAITYEYKIYSLLMIVKLVEVCNVDKKGRRKKNIYIYASFATQGRRGTRFLPKYMYSIIHAEAYNM